jgi:hypothetical protein
MRLLLRAGQILLATAVVGAAPLSCYTAGEGAGPPNDAFYFPVGLAVSPDGNVLYAVNSDFDLQFNGGTLQSYDLGQLRADAKSLIAANLAGGPLPGALPDGGLSDAGLAGRLFRPTPWRPNCTDTPPSDGLVGPNGRILGEACSPPVDSKDYLEDSVVIGAFATDLQVSLASFDSAGAGAPGSPTRRLFLPVRGDTTLSWAAVTPGAFASLDCGQVPRVLGRCVGHQAGSATDPGNTRAVAMPGEPFGMAQSEDGNYIAITHQTDTKTSLLLTGAGSSSPTHQPSMQFVLDGLPLGGVGIAAVPHDIDAPVKPCECLAGSSSGGASSCAGAASVQADAGPAAPSCVRPAFLETFKSAAEIDLLRLYDDLAVETGIGGSLHRPFLQREGVFPIRSNAVGIDSRGIVIDPTPRITCKKRGGDPAACAQLAARVFFASRTPPALGIGEVGGPPVNGTDAYNPDQLVLTGNVPLPNGPSNIYLAPVIDATGVFALRVFVVCFEAQQIVVYNPDTAAIERVINVGLGPFAMAFDPFLADPSVSPPPGYAAFARYGRWWTIGEKASALGPPLSDYHFAYVASFSRSYLQFIDVNDSSSDPASGSETFERVVFTLGQPTVPKGQ